MKLAVVGTGYVGLVSGTCFAEMGNHVVCIDNDPAKLKKLKNSEVTIYEPGLEVLFNRNIKQNRLEFTDDLKSAVLDSDIVFLCLPTPQGEDGSADLQYVMKVAEDIGDILKNAGDKDYKIIVNKSTVPVGTGKKVKQILSDKGISNFAVVSNPEFLREGYAVDDFMKPDRIVIGSDDKKALAKMKTLYQPFVRQGNPILEMNLESSEITKYAANSYLAMRITYMNELANFCEKVGGDVDMVRIGMGTDTRIGKRFLFPGIGYGGSCFPKDVNALIKTSVEKGSPIQLLELVDRINKNQKMIIVKKLEEHFNGDLKGKTFAVWGLSFKPNTDDMREAPSIYIIKDLLRRGAKIKAFDPAAFEQAAFYFKDEITYSDSAYETLDDAEALLVLTEWNVFRNPDFDEIKKRLKNNVIFDGRNIYRPEEMHELGFKYYSIGREAVK